VDHSQALCPRVITSWLLTLMSHGRTEMANIQSNQNTHIKAKFEMMAFVWTKIAQNTVLTFNA